MNRNMVFVVLLLVGGVLSACSSMGSMKGSSSDLISALTKQLGVSNAQAEGGTASILALAQQKLAAGDFDSIAKAIPSSDKYLAVAKQVLGGAGITDKAGLQSAFSMLGMSPDMVGKFAPIVTDYVGKAGGDRAKNLLAGVLK
jgi:hypothetical protein